MMVSCGEVNKLSVNTHMARHDNVGMGEIYRYGSPYWRPSSLVAMPRIGPEKQDNNPFWVDKTVSSLVSRAS